MKDHPYPKDSSWREVTLLAFRAVEDGNASLVAELLELHPSLLEARDDEHRTLLRCAVEMDQVEVAAVLLDLADDLGTLKAAMETAEKRKNPRMLDLLNGRRAWVEGSILQWRFLLAALVGAVVAVVGVYDAMLDPVIRLIQIRKAFPGLEFVIPATLVVSLAFMERDSWRPGDPPSRRLFTFGWFVRILLGVLLGFELLYQAGVTTMPGPIVFFAFFFMANLSFFFHFMFP